MASDPVFRSLSPAAAAFLNQIADSPDEDGSFSLDYVKSVILPATGWPKEDFLSLLTRELARPQNERLLSRALERQSEGAFRPYSFSLTAAAGDQVPFLIVPRPETGKNGVTRVVTSLVAQPASVSRSGRPVDPIDKDSSVFKLLDVLPAYVLLIDKNHIIRFSNRVARQFFGKIDGRTCHETLRGLDAPCAQCAPFGLFSDNAIKVHDWINTRLNMAFRAHSYPFEAADGAMYVLQIGINITAGVRAKNALDLSEQRYRSIAENLTMGLALVDSDFNAITLNPRMEEWFGSSAVRGVSLADLMQSSCADGADRPAFVFAKVLTYKENQEGEFRLTLQSGETRNFRLVASPILTRARQLRAIVIMLEDVTDRRNIATQLQQMQRLEALGSLAGGIAHEINQPLSALHLYASGLQMLMEQTPETPAERVLERLSLILAQAEKIRHIISHMRALVMQEENPPLTPVPVKETVNAALGLVGMQLHDHGVSVTTGLPDDLPPVLASAMQLEQVVINLLVNAMHALDTVDDRKKTIRITAETSTAEALVLRISDNGPGLGTLQGRIFDPFFTTKDPDLGMGLGLSIVHAFVTSWGGAVEASDNQDGGGATFSITLRAIS